ncbi:hypothetical protein FHS96_005576 [Sphingomonas zeicaulis]
MNINLQVHAFMIWLAALTQRISPVWIIWDHSASYRAGATEDGSVALRSGGQTVGLAATSLQAYLKKRLDRTFGFRPGVE